MSESTESISKSIDTLIKEPILLVPALAPVIVHLFLLILAHAIFPTTVVVIVNTVPVEVPYGPNVLISAGGYLIAAIIGFIASCMVVDMTNDAINGRSIDLQKSMNLVTGRLGTLVIAAIISAVCFITFVLIPVALFIITIAILEETDAVESTKRSFDFIMKNLAEVIIFIIIVIVVWMILGIGFTFIPIVGAYVGAVLSWIFNVAFTVATVHFYLALKPGRAPPPSPPPSPSSPTFRK